MNIYRCFDVLLIDDVQLLSGEERIKSEFIRIFHVVYDAMKQVVLTSDRFPRDLANLPEGPWRRFELGLVADILPPSRIR